jgi:hypothetical protein
MRRIAMTILLSCTIFSQACKKDPGNAAGIIEGNWELVRITGNRATVNYPLGNGNLLKLTNATYELFENGQKVKSGTYAIVEDPSAETAVCLVLPADQYRNRIIYDDDYNAAKKFFQLSKDTLSIISGCFRSDAGTNVEYVRR